METKKRTEIAALGQFGLIDRLTHGFSPKNPSTLRGVGDDAAVIAPPAGEELLCSTDSFFEGVDFDLTYFPLKHLGYKVVTAGVSDILAMNARPSQIVLSLGVSAKLCREIGQGSRRHGEVRSRKTVQKKLKPIKSRLLWNLSH